MASTPASVTESCVMDDFHTHLICADCGGETVHGGYASHWRCTHCRTITAEAVRVCHSSPSEEASDDE